MISFCVTTYNRYVLTRQCVFSALYQNSAIKEIVISDDFSNDGSYESLQSEFSGVPFIKIYRNEKNLDCYFNKRRAIELATNEWCVLADSDNEYPRSYFDSIINSKIPWAEDTIFAPVFARPNFDYREFSGWLITKHNARNLITERMLPTALNTCNFFVNRKRYMEVWDGSSDPVTADSIWFCYQWLAAGNKILFVPGMEYFHRVHDGSHYQNNAHRTGNFYNEVVDKILNLK